MRRFRFALLLRVVLALAVLHATGCAGFETNSESARNGSTTHALRRVAERAKPGILGAAVLDMQTGRMSSVNGNTALPLQSVFKLPLAIYAMHLAET